MQQATPDWREKIDDILSQHNTLSDSGWWIAIPSKDKNRISGLGGLLQNCIRFLLSVNEIVGVELVLSPDE